MDAALTNVSIWTNEHGFIRADARIASQYYPNMVSATDKKCVCNICGQYVTLTGEGIQTRHFRHNGHEKNKTCKDRVLQRRNADIERHLMETPIKIEIDTENKRFRFDLGFLALPCELLDEAEKNHEMLSILHNGECVRRLCVDKVNFVTDTVSYVPLPYGIYGAVHIETSNHAIMEFWHAEIPLLHEDGTLFSKGINHNSRIPQGGGVSAGMMYYLVTHELLSEVHDIEMNLLFCYANYYVYGICARVMTHNAAVFFSRFNAKLASAHVEMFPIWPPFHTGSHVVEAKEGMSYWFSSGAIDLKTHPAQSVPSSTPMMDHAPYDQGALTCLQLIKSLSVVYAEQYNVKRYVLRYVYLRFQERKYMPEIPRIQVIDQDDNPVEFGRYSTPHENLRICTECFVRILLIRNGEIVNVIHVAAKKSYVPIDRISMGMELQFFAGMDEIGRIDYAEVNEQVEKEEVILRRLKMCNGRMVALPRRKRWVLERLRRYPKVCEFYMHRWLTGRFRIDEIAILSDLLGTEIRNHDLQAG